MLKRLEESAWRQSLDHFDPYAKVTAWDLGRLSDAASVADDAIFHVLSTARYHCHANVTDAQLFQDEREPVRPEQARKAPEQTRKAPKPTDVPAPSNGATAASEATAASKTPQPRRRRTPGSTRAR